MKFAAIVFDMDGVLIDSEPFWRQAEIEVFASVGVHLTEQECMQTTGLRIDEVVAFRHAQQPWSSASQAQVTEAILDRVVNLVQQQGRPIEGALQAVEAAQASGLPMAIASSSSYRLIRATLASLHMEEYFPVIHSAEEEALGKPHPAVYLQAAAKLGQPPSTCLAIEDSLNGVIAAKAARMTTVAIPDRHQPVDPRFCLADYQLTSPLEFPDWLERELRRPRQGSERGTGRISLPGGG
jgi:sugar-phosphatase